MAGSLVARPSFAQNAPAPAPSTLPPLPSQGPAPTYPSQPANPGYQQPPPGYQQPPPGYQHPPGYQQPPSGYQQPAPGYPPPQPPPGQPPGYPPQTVAPAYGQPPYPAYYAQPPLPPPPQRRELQWSIRFNIFDLIFGRATAEIEYAFAGPFSLTIAPQYIFGDPRQDRDLGITAKGAGIYGELGVWVEGRPLRGYFLKGHVGYANVTFHGDNDQTVDAPETRLGLMFGSQSIYGGWFTLTGGFGVAYDTQSREYSINGRDTRSGVAQLATIPASGLFGNGWDLLSQIGIGGSF